MTSSPSVTGQWPSNDTLRHEADLTLALEAAPDRALRRQLLLAMTGLTLLIAGVCAKFLFDTPYHAEMLALLAAVVLGVPIIVDAVIDLHRRSQTGGMKSSHMHELVAIAFLASFVSGKYFEAGSVAFFMILAMFIEDRTAVGARKSIESLIRLSPTKAVRRTEHGTVEVDVKDLATGDTVIVKPGDLIPCDGLVTSGHSSVNQASITGESLPADKSPGHEVFSGSINLTGLMEVKVTRAGRDTTLGKVQDLILQAAQSRPLVVKMLETYASYYSPVVLMAAGILFFFTKDMNRAISLLLIACPCAIILSGPTAMVAAISAASRLGILIKNVTDLDIARRVNAIVFDKTGTLTHGNLVVQRLIPAAEVSPADLLRFAAAAQASSKHPTAKAVLAAAQRARLVLPQVDEFHESAGRGVSARLDGQSVRVGRESWLGEQGCNSVELNLSNTDAASLLYIAVDERIIGCIALADQVRVEAPDVMKQLQQQGVQRRAMITGDRPGPALQIAAQVGINDVRPEALPGDKLQLVHELRQRGFTVAVIGDGVNDGPALAAADVSIAMGAAGSDVAIHAASIALMNNQLNRIPFLIQLSRATASIIRQNIIGVMLYIAGMLTLLAWGYMTPLVAAIAHGISSIIVVFNSARLVRQGEWLQDQWS